MDIGNLGESIFEQWASQVNLIANKAKIDKDGWDYLVGVPKTFGSNLKALDLDESHSQFLIQVKATTASKGNRYIKLSNLKRLVDSPLPAFYLVIKVSDEGIPEEAHIFHVWDEIIGRVLKRLRKVDPDDYSKLHKIRMQLPNSCSEKMQALNGKELLSFINQSIGKSRSEYIESKQKFRDEIGYQDGVGRLNFQGIIPDDYKGREGELLVDFSLGLIDKLYLTSHTFTDTRFGEEIILKDGEGGNITIKDPEPDGKAYIKMWTPDYRLNTHISTDFFLPHIDMSIVGNKNFKVLYKANFLKILVSPYKSDSNLNFNIDVPPFEEEHYLSDFSEVASFVEFIGEVQNRNENFNFSISHVPEVDVSGAMSIPNKLIESNVIKEFCSVQYALSITEYLKIKDPVKITLSSLYNQYDLLNYLAVLIKPKPTFMKVKFWVNDEIDDSKKTVLLFPVIFNIGKYNIVCLICIKGNAEISNDDKKEGKIFYSIQSSNVNLERYKLFSEPVKNLTDVLEELYSLIKSEYDEDDCVIIFLRDNLIN